MNQHERWWRLKLANNVAINGFIDKILQPILSVLQWLVGVIFSNQIVLILVYLVLVNLIAIFLMKKDKEYAQNGERRIREATLLIVALAGGSMGMYYAMFKYKHKTLHNKFSIGIPVIIAVQTIYISYLLMIGILKV